MSGDLYEVAFSGQIQKGADLEEVKLGIGKLFQVDAAKIERMFSGKRHIVQRNLSVAQARKYQAAFQAAGAVCEIVPPLDGSKAQAAADHGKPAKARKPRSRVGLAIAAGVVGLLLIGAAAVPFVAGILAEEKYVSGVNYVNQVQAAQMPFEMKVDSTYQRGWLSSTAVNRITLTLPDSDPVTFTTRDNIQHGPVFLDGERRYGLASIETTVPVSPEQQAEITKIWKGNPNPVRIHSHIDFDGTNATRIEVAEFAIEPEDGLDGSFDSGPMFMNIKLSGDMKHLVADIDWQGAQVVSEEGNMEIGRFSGRTDKTLLFGDLWLGDDEYSFSELSLKVSEPVDNPLGDAPSWFSIKSLVLTASSEADAANLIKARSSVTIDEVLVEKKVVASDLKLVFDLENLPAEPLQSLTRKLAEHQQTAMQNAGSNPMPDIAAMQGDVGQILAAGPVFRISRLEATTEQGIIEADLEATIKVEDPAMLQNPLMLMLAAQADGNVSIPAALVEGTPLAQMAPMFIAQGYIVVEDAHLKSNLSFRQGQVTVNGLPLAM